MTQLLSRGALRAGLRLVAALPRIFVIDPVAWLFRVARFIADHAKYRRMNDNPWFRQGLGTLSPCLRDRTENTPIEPVYFFQDAWGAGKIFRARPGSHVDVGSSAKTIAILAQFVPVTMVDIRPLGIELTGLNFVAGSVTALPFESESVPSLSSLCVIEHVGLGRYGDPLDPWGSEKAAAELARVLAKAGDLYVSVPVSQTSCIYFNAHRSFDRAHLLKLFAGLSLVEERYIYGTRMQDDFDPARGFGTGLFHFRKPDGSRAAP